MAHRPGEMRHSSFLKVVLYFLIDKVGAIIQLHCFAVAKYWGNVIFIDVNNLIRCVF